MSAPTPLRDVTAALIFESPRALRTHLTNLRVAPNATWDNPTQLEKSNLFDPASPANRGVRVELDGVGGVATLVRAQAHRLGAVFPGWIIDHQLETEGKFLLTAVA